MNYNLSICYPTKIVDNREWSNGKSGCLFYVPFENDIYVDCGIYCAETENAISEQNAVLVFPYANALLLGEPLLVSPLYMNDKSGSERLLELCRIWLKRDKQILSDFPGIQCMQTFEKRLVEEFIQCIDTLFKVDLFRVKHILNNKEGFFSYFLNHVIVYTIVENIKQSSSADLIAKIAVAYLHENGEPYPLEQLRFDGIDVKEIYRQYIDKRLKKLAKRDGIKRIRVEDSTEDLYIGYRQSMLKEELEYYAESEYIFSVIPKKQAEELHECIQLFFLYALNRAQLNDEMYDKYSDQIDRYLHIVRPRKIKEKQLEPIRNLLAPKLKQNGHPSSRDITDYIRTRRMYDPEFDKMCQEQSLAYICGKLEQLFGWNSLTINPETLYKYLKRRGLTIAILR